MKSAVRPLGIIIVSLFGFLVIVTRYTDKGNFELSAQDMYAKVLSVNYTIERASLGQFNSPILIDIRGPESFIVQHQESVINIPVSSILDEEYKKLFKSDSPKIILAYDPVNAHEAWMLLTQMGYKQLFVMRAEK